MFSCEDFTETTV